MRQLISGPSRFGKRRFVLQEDDTPSYCKCDGVWTVMDTVMGNTLCLMCKQALDKEVNSAQ